MTHFFQLPVTKQLPFSKFVWILLALSMPLHSFSGERALHVLADEMPPVDLSRVPETAYEKGILKIKFNAVLSDHLEQNEPVLSSDGFVSFNLKAPDRLNREFGVKDARQHFAMESFVKSFNQRHKVWELHLWYELRFDDSVDIKKMAVSYLALPEVEIAEPEYKKRLIIDPGMEWITDETMPDKSTLLSWTPNDPQYNNQWHYNNTGQQNGTPGADISLPQAWDMEKGNSEVIVAVIDHGIQYNHPDLSANMWPGVGFNFVNNSPDIIPGNHGTHVAGTVAAANNNGIGVAGVAGGDGSGNGVRLMSCQVFTESTSGGFHNAPVWAADNGAAISQNSWGYTNPGVYELSVLTAIDYFNANGGGTALNGGITIFAAGNDNDDGAWYPGYYSGAFAVAATNNQDKKSWYSNFGTWIDISAPGGETNSVNARGVLSTITGSSYAYFQGTSMACPHASGVAALIVSLAFGELDADEVADILRNTTDNHYSANPGYPGQLGTGRLNAYQALIETMNYATGVDRPMSFTATAAGADQVDLSWIKNEANDDVLIAWSPDGEFGAPANGYTYSIGEAIAGGGEVLYAGSAETFSHQELQPATWYYYKIWSESGTQYSLGRSAQALTNCQPKEVPFFEDFDESAALPVCWTTEILEGDTNWEIGEGNGGSNPASPYSAPNNIFFKQLFQTGHTARLISPELSLPEAESMELKFYYTNQKRTVSFFFNYQDILRIKYNTHQNPEWQLMATFNSNVGTWTQVSISIPDPQNIRFITFEAESETGHGVCLDNIELVMDCLAPGNVTIGEITHQSAEISWSAGGWESYWDVIYGESGFNPQQAGIQVEGIGQTHYQISGLSQQTGYDFYVRSACGNQNYSDWEGPYSFTTQAEYGTQTITIPSGWSGFSTFVHPENPQSAELFAQIMDELILVANANHLFYPFLEIDTFGEWNPYMGAQIKLENAATLEVSGMMASHGNVALTEGWNYLPVPARCSCSVEEVFGGAAEAVQIVKEIAGTGLYWPEFNINSLVSLEPGKAYLVLMSQPTNLSFPDCEE